MRHKLGQASRERSPAKRSSNVDGEQSSSEGIAGVREETMDGPQRLVGRLIDGSDGRNG